MSAVLAGSVVLADEGGKGSPIGLFVILVLCVATYFLMKSMGRHLRKVPPTFEPGAGDHSGESGESGEPGQNGTASGAGADRPA